MQCSNMICLSVNVQAGLWEERLWLDIQVKGVDRQCLTRKGQQAVTGDMFFVAKQQQLPTTFDAILRLKVLLHTAPCKRIPIP